MPRELHVHLSLRLPHLPRLSRVTKIIGAVTTVAVLSGGIAVAAAPSPGAKPANRTPSINASGVITQAGYVAITPCRAAYTRTAGGALVGGHRRGFYVGGTTGFPAQGGTSGGCRIPIGASAVALSITTTGETAAGYLTAYGTGTTRPGVRSASFVKGQSITTTAITPVNPSTGQVTVYTSATTHLVLDVTGYYREPIAVSVAADGTVLAKSNQVTSVTRFHTGGYQINFNQTVARCAFAISLDAQVYTVGRTIGTNYVYVYTTNVGASPAGYYDTGFTLTVTC